MNDGLHPFIAFTYISSPIHLTTLVYAPTPHPPFFYTHSQLFTFPSTSNPLLSTIFVTLSYFLFTLLLLHLSATCAVDFQSPRRYCRSLHFLCILTLWKGRVGLQHTWLQHQEAMWAFFCCSGFVSATFACVFVCWSHYNYDCVGLFWEPLLFQKSKLLT